MKAKSLLIAVATTALSAAGANAAVIVSSVADYEPRMEQATSSGPFIVNDVDDQTADGLGDGSIDTPSDASTVRVGGQARHKMTSAFFFPLPTLGPGSVTAAHLAFTQVEDTTVNDPVNAVDLWVVGLYSDISAANDPDGAETGSPTVGTGLSSLLYNESETDARAGLNTSVARLKLVDDFVLPSQHLDTDGNAGTTLTSAHETAAAADLALTNYLNDLYAAGVPEGSYLVVRLSAGAPPPTSTNRFLFASANNDDPALHPTLTLEVIPEPGTAAVALLGGLGALLRRRRS